MRRIYAILWPLSIVVAVVLCCLLHGRKHIPPTVAMRVDSTPSATPGQWYIKSTHDKAMSKEITDLRAENTGRKGGLGSALSHPMDMNLEARVRVDTITVRELESIPGIYRVDKSPGGIRIYTYADTLAAKWSRHLDRERWSLFPSGRQIGNCTHSGQLKNSCPG